MASREELYQALRNADAAGDVEAATKLASYIQSLPPDQPIAAPVVAKPSKERTFGEAAKDIAAGVVSGAGSLVQLPGQLYGLATGDFSETGALGLGKDIEKYGEEMKSPGLKAREAERAEKIKTAEKTGQWEAFKTAFGETIKDPALLTSFLAEQAPQLLVPFGAAKVAQIGTAAKAAAAAEGLVGKAAEKAVGEVTKAAAERGTRAAIGAGAVQQGADVGAQAYEDIYKELKRKGASDSDAAQGAINLARAAGASGALISILAQRLPGARTLEESFAGVPGTGGRLLSAAKGALGEGLSEVVEETGGKFGANLAMREVKPEQSLLEGLGQTAGMAAVGGVGMGGVSGLARRSAAEAAKPEAEAPKPEAPAEPQKAEAEAPKPVTGEAGIVRPEEETPISREVTKAAEPEVAPPAVISSSVPATKMPVTENYADMTVEALRSAKETADETNLQMDLSAIRKHFGEDAATAYAGMNRRQRNKWWDANATESFERDSSVFNGVNEETIDEYIQAYNKFDTESPQSLGRSIALIARKINDPDFIGSPEYLTLKNALSYAKEQGWSEKQVLDAMRGRASEWAGADAQELFKDLFKYVPKQTATTQTDSSLTKREELKALPPTVSPEPSIAEDRQRAEPVEPQKAEAEAPKPVTGEAGIVRPEEEVAVPEPVVAEAAKPEEVAPEAEAVPQAEISKPAEPQLVQQKEPKTAIAEAPDTLTDDEFDQYEREQIQEASSRLSAGDYAAPRPATFVRPGMRSKVDEAMDRAKQNAYKKAVRKFLQAPLTAKPPTGKSEGIDYSIYDAVDGLTDVEPQRIETKAPVAKSFQNKLEVLFKYVVPSKDIRYYLTRVMLDPEKSRMVATDGKSLVIVEDESVKQNAPERPLGVTRDKAILVDKDGTWATTDDGRPMEAIYPDVDKVIPKTDRTDAVSYNTDDFVAYAKGVEKSNKFVKKDLPLVIQIFNKQNAFDVERLVSLGEVFRRLGYKNFVVTLPNDPLDGRLMATSPDGKVKQIVMSRKYGETTGEIKRRFYKPYDPVAIKKSLRAAPAQQVTDFEQTLRTALNKFGLKDVGVKLVEGMREEGSYAQQLIQIAADSANPIRTLRHEAIHALRELGFFTPQQWQSLSKMAKDKWIDQYLKQRNVDGKPLKAGEESRYDAYMREYEGDMEKITEEAVADAFADFDATKPRAGLMQALLTRLRNLFQAIKSALTKVESPEQIFGKVERGELVAGEAKPEAVERLSLRKEEQKPTPTTAGQQALDTINQLGMGVKPPEPNLRERVKKKLERIGEAPTKESMKQWKTAMSDFFSKIDGQIFSADAPFENKIRQGRREDFKGLEEFVGTMLTVSQSQAVGPDAVATQAMLIGKPEYRKDLYKWVAVKDPANEVEKAKILDGIAKKYGLTKEEAIRVAHTYLSAANYEGILKRNAENAERVKELRDEGKTDEAAALKAAEVYVTPEQAAMVEPGLAIADQIPEVKQITELWNKQRENVKNVLVETGLWTPEYADAMMDNAAYVPFYREMEDETDASPEMMMRGLQVKAKEHKLKGSAAPVADVFENMAKWQQYALNRAIRNHKAVQMINVAKEMKMGDEPMAKEVSEAKRGKNVVRVWEGGKQKFYEMSDPLFMDAFKSLGAVSIPTIKYFTAIANMLRQSIVLYPMFSVGQVPQDAVAAIFASGLQPKYAFKIPFYAIKEAIQTYRGMSKIHDELRDFGAVGVRDFNSATMRQDAEITAGLKIPRGGVEKVKFVLERIAMSADNAVRQAVYQAAMEQPGVTQAEALEKAFEIINFRRRGSSKMVNLIGQTVPFFYAYLSAQRVAYKTITGVGISPVERKAALDTLAYTSAAVMALSFMYAMANGDDEDYEKVPSNVRDRSIVIPGTGGLRIPLRPDFFLFPKIIAEHTYHLMADNGFSDPAKFKKAMRDNFVNAATSPNVVPQIIKPAFEIGINYDFFQGKPIIGFFEQNKEASRQFNDSTSEFAKFMGGAGLSPQKVDHFIRGYFGTVGGLFLWTTNFMMEGEPGVPRPELSWHDVAATMPGIGAFKQKSTENALKVDFYELRDAVEKAKNTYDDIKKRSPEGLRAYVENEENYAKLALEKRVTKVAEHLSKIRQTIQQVAAAPEGRYTAEEKQERIKELRDIELRLLKAVDVKGMREKAMM